MSILIIYKLYVLCQLQEEAERFSRDSNSSGNLPVKHL